MPVDYDKKMTWITYFFDQSTEELEIVKNDIKQFNNDYGIDLLTKEISEVKQKLSLIDLNDKLKKRSRQLVIHLGMIGEYSLKYIILLEQLEQFPNQTLEEFQNKALYKLSNNKVANTYKDKYHLDETKIDLISSFRDDNNQALHNYNYLFKILESFYQHDVENLYTLMNLRIRSNLIKDSNIPLSIKKEFLCFPQKIFLNVNDVSSEQRAIYEKEFKRIIEESGDVFATLRYLENNPHEKEYDFYNVYSLMCYVVEYIQLINFNNNRLHDDITNLFNKQACLNYMLQKYNFTEENIEQKKKEWKLESERINNLYSIPRITNNTNLLIATIFRSSLSFEEIVKIVDLKQYNDDELYSIFVNNIDSITLNYFFKRDITEAHIIISILNKSKNDERIKEYVCDCEKIDNKHFMLLEWLSFDLLEKVSKNEKIDNYLINNKGVLQTILGENQSSEDYIFFEKIISLEEVQHNPYILEGLDYQQQKICSSFTDLQISENVIIDNIKENFRLFKDTPELIKNLPMMLDPDNNQKIVNLLVANGLNLNQLNNLDGTVFCIPYDIVCYINDYLRVNNVSLIIDNDCCPEFYNIIEKIRKQEEFHSKNPLPLRHRKKNQDNDGDSEQKKLRA